MPEPSPLRRQAHHWSLLFCGAVGSYLISVVLAARLSMWLAEVIRSSPSALARVGLGVVALDLSKAPGLLLVTLVLATAVTLGPRAFALGLILMVYAMELIITLMLGQAAWLFGEPIVLVCRVLAAALLGGMVILILRRRRARAMLPPT